MDPSAFGEFSIWDTEKTDLLCRFPSVSIGLAQPAQTGGHPGCKCLKALSIITTPRPTDTSADATQIMHEILLLSRSRRPWHSYGGRRQWEMLGADILSTKNHSASWQIRTHLCMHDTRERTRVTHHRTHQGGILHFRFFYSSIFKSICYLINTPVGYVYVFQVSKTANDNNIPT